MIDIYDQDTARAYDERVPAEGIEISHLLREFNAALGEGRCGSVTLTDSRPVGSRVWAIFAPVLTGEEISAAADIFAAHSGAHAPTGSCPVMVLTEDHDLHEVHECLVVATVEAVTVRLPPVSEAPDIVYPLKCTGTFDTIFVPRAGEEIDGAESLIVTPGRAVRIGAGDDGNWHNVAQD